MGEQPWAQPRSRCVARALELPASKLPSLSLSARARAWPEIGHANFRLFFSSEEIFLPPWRKYSSNSAAGIPPPALQIPNHGAAAAALKLKPLAAMALVPPLATTGLPRTPAHAAGLPPPTPHANTGRRLSKSIMRADSQDQENSKGWGMVTLRDSRGIDTEVQPAPRHRPAFTRAHVALLGLHTLRPRDAVSPHACYASSHHHTAQPSHA